MRICGSNILSSGVSSWNHSLTWSVLNKSQIKDSLVAPDEGEIEEQKDKESTYIIFPTMISFCKH